MDQLSSIDASFLHLETPETPMHVGSLMLFELPEGYQGDYYEDVKAMLGKRLHLASVLHRKLAQMPFELSEPVWIEDDDIDIDYHVRSVTLRRPGTMQQLEALIARLHSTLLDRSRPLWEMYVIEGLENGEVAFYSKAHHSGVDGKAGVELAKVLYDVSPKMREVPPPRRKRGSSSYQLGITELLQAAVANSASQYRKLADVLPGTAKALAAAAKVVASQRAASGARSLNLGTSTKDDLQRLDHQPAFLQHVVGGTGGHQGTWQARRWHCQYHRDDDVQYRTAPFSEGARPAATGTAHRHGPGQPAHRRRQRDEQSGVDGAG
jgi:diacylglycerol O-acyltransferase